MKRRRKFWTGKILSLLLSTSVLFASVQLLVFATETVTPGTTVTETVELTESMSDESIQAALTAAIAAPETGTVKIVTVTGSKQNVGTMITLEIPDDVTVNWGADLTGTGGDYLYCLVLEGAGVFNLLEKGKIENTANSSPECALYQGGSVQVDIRGRIKGYHGIVLGENAVLKITGGTVESTGIGISPLGTYSGMIAIEDGHISSTGESSTGGTSTGGSAILLRAGTVQLSGTNQIQSQAISGIIAKHVQVVSGTSTVSGNNHGIVLDDTSSSLTVGEGAVLTAKAANGAGISCSDGTFTVKGTSHIIASGFNDSKEPSIVAGAGDYYWYSGEKKPTEPNSYQWNAKPTKGKYMELISVGHLNTMVDNGDGTHTLTCKCSEATVITGKHQYGQDADGACLCGARPVAKTTVTSGETVAWYGTFAEALEAVNNESFQGTLTLLDDVTTAAGGAAFTAGKITLDLNGKTVTGNLLINGADVILIENSTGNSTARADFVLIKNSASPEKHILAVDSWLTGTYSITLQDAEGKTITGTLVRPASTVILDDAWFASADEDYVVVEEDSNLVLKKDLAKAAITINSESVEYNASGHKPEITVKWKDQELVAGTDYTLTWNGAEMPQEGLVNAGTYRAVVTGKGDYGGSLEKTFTITQKSLTWDTSGLTASKPETVSGEVVVYGELVLNGFVGNDTYAMPSGLKTSGLSGYTTPGSYLVTVVPESGSWNFQAESGNYLWPTDSPIIEAEIHKVESLSTPPEAVSGGAALKLEMEEGISKVPAGLATDSGLNTPEKIETVLRTLLTQADSSIEEENTAVYDVTLLVSEDGGTTWRKVDAAHWPADGKLTVTLPYPAGTGKNTHNFTVVHMFTTSDFGKTPGATELPSVTKTDAGLQFRVTGLSPIIVGWKEVPKSSSSETPSEPVFRTGEWDFWMQVKEQIETVKDGTVIRVHAKDYSRMPIKVMEALADREDVTLSITWNAGGDIHLPSKLAPTPEKDRALYELSELAAVFPAPVTATVSTPAAPAKDTEEAENVKTTSEEPVEETEKVAENTEAEVKEEAEETEAVEEEPAEQEPEKEEEGIGWLTILILVILVILLFGFVVWILLKRRQQEDDDVWK